MRTEALQSSKRNKFGTMNTSVHTRIEYKTLSLKVGFSSAVFRNFSGKDESSFNNHPARNIGPSSLRTSLFMDCNTASLALQVMQSDRRRVCKG